MPDKPKIGFYWCGGCGGCEESFLDLAEDLPDVLERVDLAFCPALTDFKKQNVEALPDGSLLATLINGCVRTSEQEEMARLLRRKSRLLVAYGSCAHTGGVPALANQLDRERILRCVYEETISTVNERKVRPAPVFQEDGRTVQLPEFRRLVRTLDQVVAVDYYVPGCPPTPELFKQALDKMLSEDLPPKGTVLAPDVALCKECPRRETKPAELRFTEFKRPHRVMLSAEKCFLAQGVVCIGPATRGGCGSSCIRGNMPCTGCFGPTSRVRDQGAKMLSSLASSAGGTKIEEIEPVLSGIPDPVGTFYRYGLAASLLRRKGER